jgi:hypothetical protein
VFDIVRSAVRSRIECRSTSLRHSDWLVDRASTAWIAEVTNRTTPGSGRFVVLHSIHHSFFRATVDERAS